MPNAFAAFALLPWASSRLCVMASRSIDSSGLRRRRLRAPVSGVGPAAGSFRCGGAARLGAWSGKPARRCRASWSASTSAVLLARRSAGPGSRAARRRRARVAGRPRYGDAAADVHRAREESQQASQIPALRAGAERDGDPDGTLTVDFCGLLQGGCQGA